MKNKDALIEAICQAYDNPLFKPSDGITHCNEACSSIASMMGCRELEGRLANDLADYMAASGSWVELTMDKAQWTANQGSLVFAVQKGNPHGHICVIRPGLEKTSGKWNRQAPSVMNIGKDVFIAKGLNWAFQDIPKIYAWKESL